MKNGVIPNTLEQLEIVFKELRSLGPIAVVTLERDWRTRRAVERDLQITLTLLAYVCPYWRPFWSRIRNNCGYNFYTFSLGFNFCYWSSFTKG